MTGPALSAGRRLGWNKRYKTLSPLNQPSSKSNMQKPRPQGVLDCILQEQNGESQEVIWN